MTRKHPRLAHNTDTYVIADVRPTLLIHDSSITGSGVQPQFGPAHGQLLMVADGIGERASAARASALVVDRVNAQLLDAFGLPGVGGGRQQHLFSRFREALADCRAAMENEVKAAERFEEMGAVLTLIYMAWPKAHVLHIGNNRAYHFRDGSVEQVTKDQTMASRLVHSGQLSARRADKSRLRHVICSFVGTHNDHMEPEYDELQMGVGDALLLCSDGMATCIREEDIVESVESTDSAEATCQALLGVAENNGLDDDATVVVARFADQETAERLLAREMALPASESVPPGDEFAATEPV